jgi:hypothetical protein
MPFYNDYDSPDAVVSFKVKKKYNLALNHVIIIFI